MAKREDIFALLSVLLVVFTVATSMWYATNIPYLDDYNLVLQFLAEFISIEDWKERWYLLVESRNDHRIIWYKLCVLIDYYLWGEVNFVHLAAGSNAALVLLTLLFWKMQACLDQSNQLRFLMLLVLLAPYWAVVAWCSSGMTSLWMIVWAMASLYSVTIPGRWTFIGALIWAILASFTFGGGLWVFVAGGLVLWLSGRRKPLAIWALASILIWSLYFLGFEAGEKPEGILPYVLHQPHIVVANILLFVGAPLKVLYGDRHLWGLLGGVFISAGFLYWLIRNYGKLKSEPLLVGLLVFCWGLALFTAVARSPFGLGATTAYRYRLLQMLPYLSFLLVLFRFQTKHVLQSYPFILMILLVFWGLRLDINIDQLQHMQQRLQLGLLNHQLTGQHDQLSHRVTPEAAHWLEVAESLDFYQPPEMVLSYGPLQSVKRAGLEAMTLIRERETLTDTYYELRGWAYLTYKDIGRLQVLGVAQGDVNRAYFPAGPYLHSDALIELNHAAFVLTIPRAQLDGQEISAIALYHPVRGIVAEHPLENTASGTGE